ncbi:MAG: M15 family metallopeptidase, partial [Zoogloea sp.]|nr:M15 family metallopeptidase [Zoogloea sp.]
MSGFNFLGLVAFVGGLLFLLAWVGWRFFRLGVLPEPALEPPAPARETASPQAALELPPSPGVRMPLRLRRMSRPLLFALLVGGAAVAAVFGWSGYIVPDPLSAVEMERQEHIQTALNPEPLVPPPALPPSMFVGSERPALESADRDWSKLDQHFAAQVLVIFGRLRERGYSFALLEGYRSPERQEMLAGLGSH